jgi:hypothetical protein
MYNAPPPHLMQGIQLVKAGRHADALPYLRHAVRTETVTAEGWLWLAAATRDLDEYRNCVKQALRLDPDHPVALQMRGDLQRYHALPPASQPPTSYWPQPAHPAWNAPPFIPTPDEFATLREGDDTTRAQRPSRLRRILRAVVLVVIVGGCIGGIAALVASGIIQDTAREWLATDDSHVLDFTVGETPAYHFQVEVPASWLPANTDNPSWRDTRDDLIARFPPATGQDSIWEQLDESFSAAVRNPVYGDVLPPVHIVETDPDRLDASSMITTLTLTEISPFPGTAAAAPASDTPEACAHMRTLESAYQSGDPSNTLSLPPGGEPVPDASTTLAARTDLDDCIFAIQRRYPVPASFTPPTLPGQMPQALRLVWIAVPAGAARYAVWTVTFAESEFSEYERAVDRVLATLQYKD